MPSVPLWLCPEVSLSVTGKIAIEEHFGIAETLRESAEYAVPGQLNVLERRMLDVDDERLREMDTHGIAFAILSLNAPGRAVSARSREGDRPRAARQRRAGRRGREAPRSIRGLRGAADAGSGRGLRRVIARGEGPGVQGRTGQRLFAGGRPDTVVYYDDPIYEPFWATIASLNVPFYLHPRDPLPSRVPIYDGHPWLWGASWAFGVETATHALRLMASGLFDRIPS